MIFVARPPFDCPPEDFQQAFDRLMAQEGEVYRQVKSRRTLCFSFQNKSYFIKQHTGIGLLESLKDLFKGRCPIFGARNEWRALQLLQKINVPAPMLVAYGQRGFLPCHQQSFVLTEALENTLSLDDIIPMLVSNEVSLPLKRVFLKTVAQQISRMHAAGLNHRDCYLVHFRFDRRLLTGELPASSLQLFVLDLHRAQIRKHVPTRWKIKDLAGLAFSSEDIGLSLRDKLRFIRYYHAQPLREILPEYTNLWAAVAKQATKLYERHQRRKTASHRN